MHKHLQTQIKTTFQQIALAFIILTLFGCAPSIKRIGYTEIQTKQQNICDVSIIKQTENENNIGTSIGSIRIEDSGFSLNCGENEVISILKAEICSQGGNVVYITDETQPSLFGSSCYQVSADLYKSDLKKVHNDINEQIDTNKTILKPVNKSNPALTVLGFAGGFVLGYVLVTILLN
jgi:hypothetical protein